MRSYGQGSYGPEESRKPNSKSLPKVVRYYFDNIIAKPGNFLVFIILIGFTLALMMTMVQYSLEVYDEETKFNDNWWQSIVNVLKLSAKGETWTERLMAFLFWTFSIAISGIVIGFLTGKIRRLTTQLNKGRSNVIKKNHILIIGWSNNVFAILKELNIANENVRNQIVVIYADRSNEDMQDDLKTIGKKLKHLKLVTRTGSLTKPDDLEITNPNEAKAIIVLNNEEKSDPIVVTTCLALCALLWNKNISIIASLVNASYAESIRKIKDFDIIPVLSESVISNVTAQACRARGLGLVVIDFLDFDGDELYFKSVPQLSGKTYQEALVSFDKSAVIGLVNENKEMTLAPAGDTIITEKDELILVAEDDSTIVYHANTFDLSGTSIAYTPSANPAKMLFIGWSATGVDILNSMTGFLPEGSAIDVVYISSKVEESSVEDKFENAKFNLSFQGLDDEMFDIEKIVLAKDYDDVVILGYTDKLSTEEADTLTLLKNLQLDSVAASSEKQFRAITQLINSSKAELARMGDEQEMIVSDNLSALLMAQLVENPHLIHVFNDLFDSDGASINIFPIEKYAQLDQETAFSSIVINGGLMQESAIGLIFNAVDKSSQSEGLQINPSKNMKITPQAGDKVIVISDPS